MREEESDWDALSLDRCAVHQLVLHDVLGLVITVGAGSRSLSANNRQFHVLYLDAHEQKIYLAQNNILWSVSVTGAGNEWRLHMMATHTMRF